MGEVSDIGYHSEGESREAAREVQSGWSVSNARLYISRMSFSTSWRDKVLVVDKRLSSMRHGLNH
jgi:hypothetical protein